MCLLMIHDGELEHVACLVPTPGVHVRHLHGELEPACARLQGKLRELLLVDVLHGSVGAHRTAVEHLEVPDDAYPDAPALQGGDLGLHVKYTAARLGAPPRLMEPLARLRRVLPQGCVPGEDEFGGRSLVDAEHLLGPREIQGRVAVFPATHLGGALRLGQQVRQPLDLRDIDAAPNRPHRVALGIALDEAALEHRAIASAGIADAIAGRPAAPLDQRETDLPVGSIEIARMDALAPGIDHRRQIFGLYAQDLAHASRAVHSASHQVPFENDAVDRFRGESEKLLALRELALHVFTIVDVVRGDGDAIDQRVIKRGDVV